MPKHIRFMHVQLKTEQGGIVKNYYLSLKALGRHLRQKEHLDLVSESGFCVIIYVANGDSVDKTQKVKD